MIQIHIHISHQIQDSRQIFQKIIAGVKKLEVRIRNDSVEIDGYVNAIERTSKPIPSRFGKFVERIKKGAFKRAIENNDDIHILLNHNWDRDLGSTKVGNLELTEDNIGLRARAIIKDSDVIKKARNGDLVGWSFGFTDKDVDSHDENGILTRDVKDMNLYEVSILDRSRIPAYDGTLVSVRSAEGFQYCGEPCITDVNTRDLTEKKPIDYKKFENMITEMKGDKHNG